jgi:hypothetical protein
LIIYRAGPCRTAIAFLSWPEGSERIARFFLSKGPDVPRQDRKVRVERQHPAARFEPLVAAAERVESFSKKAIDGAEPPSYMAFTDGAGRLA